MKVAVVILNWNGEKMLQRFLPIVMRHSQNPETEVWVVDNASTDNSLTYLRSVENIHLLQFDKNWGFAEGYNKAIQQIEAEYIVLLNSDVEVTSNWLSPMIEYLDSHSSVVACQPKIKDYNKKNYFEYAGASGGFIDRYGYPYCRGRIFNCLEEDRGQYDMVVPISWASGAALFIRRAAYLDVGGLDHRFFAHMEEIDLCWRLVARGGEIVVIPQSEVYHVGGGTLHKSNPKKSYLNFRNNLLMLYKNLPDDELKRVMFVRFFFDYLAAFVFLLKGEYRHAQAVLVARRDFSRLKSEFAADRNKNLSKTIVENGFRQIKICILEQFYLRKQKYYSRIKR